MLLKTNLKQYLDQKKEILLHATHEQNDGMTSLLLRGVEASEVAE